MKPTPPKGGGERQHHTKEGWESRTTLQVRVWGDGRRTVLTFFFFSFFWAALLPLPCFGVVLLSHLVWVGAASSFSSFGWWCVPLFRCVGAASPASFCRLVMVSSSFFGRWFGGTWIYS